MEKQRVRETKDEDCCGRQRVDSSRVKLDLNMQNDIRTFVSVRNILIIVVKSTNRSFSFCFHAFPLFQVLSPLLARTELLSLTLLSIAIIYNYFTQSSSNLSVAVVAWELFTGECPYQGMNHIEVHNISTMRMRITNPGSYSMSVVLLYFSNKDIMFSFLLTFLSLCISQKSSFPLYLPPLSLSLSPSLPLCLSTSISPSLPLSGYFVSLSPLSVYLYLCFSDPLYYCLSLTHIFIYIYTRTHARWLFR